MGFSPHSSSLSAAKGFCLFSISSKYSSAPLSRTQGFIWWIFEFPKVLFFFFFCACKLKAGYGHHLLCYPAGYFFICYNALNECNYVRIKQVSDLQPLLKKQYKSLGAAPGSTSAFWMV